MFVNLYIIFCSICIIKFSRGEYITIPFRIIKKDEPNLFLSLDDYFNYWYNLSFYSELLIGTPEQKILTKLTFDDYGMSILNKGCEYDSNLKNIICMPTTGIKIGHSLEESNKKIHYANTLEEAYKISIDVTEKEKACILSPAAASYEFFKNFEEKGKAFEEIVKNDKK